MNAMTLTDYFDEANDGSEQIVCPIIHGLTASQADCAIVMPIGNANQLVVESLQQIPPSSTASRKHAAVLCADPFVRVDDMARVLADLGITGVVNWPTSIFLEDGAARDRTPIPVTSEIEFRWLARASQIGDLEATAFVLNRSQGLMALELGIGRIIIHPGLPSTLATGSEPSFAASLTHLISDFREAAPATQIFIYNHPGLRNMDAFATLDIEGTVGYTVTR